jgi:hypothetical protein
MIGKTKCDFWFGEIVKPDFNPEYGENYYSSFVIDLNGHNLEAVCRKEI